MVEMYPADFDIGWHPWQLVDVRIYTDGSCWNRSEPRTGAWAARVDYTFESGVVAEDGSGARESDYETQYLWGREIDPLVTSNMMEIKAILEALRILPTALVPYLITLISDSEWAIKTLNNEYQASKYLDDHPIVSWEVIRAEERRLGGVKFVHVNGHIGIEGNEECDAICGIVRRFGYISIDNLERIIHVKA